MLLRTMKMFICFLKKMFLLTNAQLFLDKKKYEIGETVKGTKCSFLGYIYRA